MRAAPAVVDYPPPACWAWPVTADDLARAAAAGEGSAPRILYEWQRGRCAACGWTQRIKWELDHDHDTARVRGWLCQGCNCAEPGAEDGSTLSRYRDRNPATMLGVDARYWHVVYGWAEPAPPPPPLAADPSYLVSAIVNAIAIATDGTVACGRPDEDGNSCPRPRLRNSLPDTEPPFWPACEPHLTDAEHMHMRIQLAAAEAHARGAVMTEIPPRHTTQASRLDNTPGENPIPRHTGTLTCLCGYRTTPRSPWGIANRQGAIRELMGHECSLPHAHPPVKVFGLKL